MVEAYGLEEWARIVEALQQLYENELERKVDYNCQSLETTEEALDALRADVEKPLVIYQESLGDACGDCDIRLWQFAGEYLKLMAREWFFLQVVQEGGLAGIFGIVQVLRTWDEIEELACDYDCYWDNRYPGMVTDLVEFYMAHLIADASRLAQEFLECEAARDIHPG